MKKYKILIVEDMATDAELTEHELHKGGLQFISKRTFVKHFCILWFSKFTCKIEGFVLHWNEFLQNPVTEGSAKEKFFTDINARKTIYCSMSIQASRAKVAVFARIKELHHAGKLIPGKKESPFQNPIAEAVRTQMLEADCPQDLKETVDMYSQQIVERAISTRDQSESMFNDAKELLFVLNKSSNGDDNAQQSKC